ncbi:AAA family ATPase [Bradyrhizobium sp. PSBB068]|nr:AAA family ATPase [Bradyrhizobium sp. PSBB068]
MIRPPIKIGITGTHSTGKSTFFDALEQELKRSGLIVCRISDIARAALSLGFPILTKHTFESTLWIMAECMRRETEASLTSDVILVDRPVIDALGYLRAALQVSHRELDERRLDELATIVKAHTPDYDLLIATFLDKSVEIGKGRDPDTEFRDAAGRHINMLVSELTPDALRLTSSNGRDVLKQTVMFIISRLPTAAS